METPEDVERKKKLISQIFGAVEFIRDNALQNTDHEVQDVVEKINDFFRGILQMENWDLYRSAEARNLASPFFCYLEVLSTSMRLEEEDLEEMRNIIQEHTQRLEEMLKDPEFAGRHEVYRE